MPKSIWISTANCKDNYSEDEIFSLPSPGCAHKCEYSRWAIQRTDTVDWLDGLCWQWPTERGTIKFWDFGLPWPKWWSRAGSWRANEAYCPDLRFAFAAFRWWRCGRKRPSCAVVLYAPNPQISPACWASSESCRHRLSASDPRRYSPNLCL